MAEGRGGQHCSTHGWMASDLYLGRSESMLSPGVAQVRGVPVEIAFTLSPLVAAKLIVYTFGALVNLFLMVLILGQAGTATYGRRRLEWLLFALFSAAFVWNSGNLLSLNVAFTYGSSSRVLWQLGRLIPFAGFVAAPPLLVHVHREYLALWRPWNPLAKLTVILFYLPLLAAPWAIERLVGNSRMMPLLALRPFLLPLTLWMLAALTYSAALDFWLGLQTIDTPSASCHLRLAGLQVALATMGALAWIIGLPPSMTLGSMATLVMFLAVLPGAFVGYAIYRYNFLNLRLERNVLYSVVAIFLLLIYIDFIRRLSGFLEGHHLLPAAVTEGVMIFLMVVFLEPAKKRIGRALEWALLPSSNERSTLPRQSRNLPSPPATRRRLSALSRKMHPANWDCVESVSAWWRRAHHYRMTAPGSRARRYHRRSAKTNAAAPILSRSGAVARCWVTSMRPQLQALWAPINIALCKCWRTNWRRPLSFASSSPTK